MTIRTHPRRITRMFGITLVAGALAVASAVTAHAAVCWELVGGRQIWLTNDNKGTCVQSGGWFTAQPGAQFNTLVFHHNGRCTDGAGQQRRSTVPASPSTGYRRFDATSCNWVVQQVPVDLESTEDGHDETGFPREPRFRVCQALAPVS